MRHVMAGKTIASADRLNRRGGGAVNENNVNPEAQQSMNPRPNIQRLSTLSRRSQPTAGTGPPTA
jgi:hypothetical protein